VWRIIHVSIHLIGAPGSINTTEHQFVRLFLDNIRLNMDFSSRNTDLLSSIVQEIREGILPQQQPEPKLRILKDERLADGKRQLSYMWEEKIPSRVYSLLIGKGGCNIRRLEKSLGLELSVRDKNDHRNQTGRTLLIAKEGESPIANASIIVNRFEEEIKHIYEMICPSSQLHVNGVHSVNGVNGIKSRNEVQQQTMTVPIPSPTLFENESFHSYFHRGTNGTPIGTPNEQHQCFCLQKLENGFNNSVKLILERLESLEKLLKSSNSRSKD
jgi:hypothetical protein